MPGRPITREEIDRWNDMTDETADPDAPPSPRESDRGTEYDSEYSDGSDRESMDGDKLTEIETWRYGVEDGDEDSPPSPPRSASPARSSSPPRSEPASDREESDGGASVREDSDGGASVRSVSVRSEASDGGASVRSESDRSVSDARSDRS